VSRYTDDSIERVREAVDMVALVGAKTDLRRVGSRWVGLCPFHDERTPSFSVNGEEKLYYCFGCEAKGDAITFVRDTEALDFPEAVELLAERHGVELKREREDPRAEERRKREQRRYSLLERTAQFYAAYLWDSSEAAPARAYLHERGLGEEVLRDFRVGYAPSAWDRVIVGAQRDGFGLDDLVDVGLAQRGRGGGLYDRFRARIMFPLVDWRGKVLGFGARALRDGQQPKYLNTSENDIYKKGQQLFGIDKARPQAARSNRVVVVEGYTDVLALHQVGVRDCVAIMGTALTQPQISTLGQAVGDGGIVHLALDADRSGQEAMLRAARAARDQEMELQVVEMPEGTDPAELVAEHGVEDFLRRLEVSLSVIEFQVRRVLANGNLETPGGRDQVLEEVRPLIAATPQRSATRDALVRLVSDRVDRPPEVVISALSQPPPKPSQQTASSAGVPSFGVEETFLAMCVRSGELGRQYLERIEDEHLSFGPTKKARLHLLANFDDPLVGVSGEDDPDFARLVKRLVVDDPLAGLSESDPISAERIKRIVAAGGGDGAVPEIVLQMEELQLRERFLERELRRIAAEEPSRRGELAAAQQRIRRDIGTLMGQTV
jgi:DNA primase